MTHNELIAYGCELHRKPETAEKMPGYYLDGVFLGETPRDATEGLDISPTAPPRCVSLETMNQFGEKLFATARELDRAIEMQESDAHEARYRCFMCAEECRELGHRLTALNRWLVSVEEHGVISRPS